MPLWFWDHCCKLLANTDEMSIQDEYYTHFCALQQILGVDRLRITSSAEVWFLWNILARTWKPCMSELSIQCECEFKDCCVLAWCRTQWKLVPPQHACLCARTRATRGGLHDMWHEARGNCLWHCGIQHTPCAGLSQAWAQTWCRQFQAVFLSLQKMT